MKNLNILGITAPISENSAACLVQNGKLISFVEEERFSGIKYAPRTIPKKSIEYCLNSAKLKAREIDYIAIGYENVFSSWIKNIISNLLERNFYRLIRENGAYLEYFLKMFRLEEYFLELGLSKEEYKKKLIYIPHHISHAASSLRASGFTESLVISIDGVGENNAGLLGYFKNNKITKLQNIPINQSLGWFYSTATNICGFKPHSHEGKLMGLAAYGKPNLKLFKNIISLTKNGYHLHRDWTNTMESKFKKRNKNEKITAYYKNIAATTQYFLEQAVTNLAKDLYKKHPIKYICLAGGVALNCDMSSKLMGLGIFDNIFVQPAANDAGTALGAAMEAYTMITNKKCEKITHAYYGPSFSNQEIEHLLKESKIKYRKLKSIKEIAKNLYQGKIVGWFSGREEFGPRALGGKSILANPSLKGMKNKINNQVKHREPWRPFAPSILKEFTNDYFENYYTSPYMLLTFNTKENKIKQISAAIHVDNTARVQEVTKESNPKYYRLINEFYKLSKIPVLLNTSFNDKEKPICLTPRDALQTFYSTGIDILVLEDYIIEK